MIDLLCLNAPFRPYFSRPSRSPCVTRGGTLYYPMSLLTMTSYAIQKGFDARIMDCIANPNPYWKTEIKKLNPRIIIVDTSTPSIYNDIKIADNLQESLPNSQVILVGRHVTYAPTETLRFCKKVKIICRKEFFTSIVELLEGKEYKKVKSVSYKEDGKIYHNPDSKLVTNVDDFGFISKIINRQLNPKRYYYSSTRNPYIMLQTAWGCPYNCSFCNEVVKHKWRHRSIDHIIEELKYLDKNMSFVKEIYWDDPTFVVDETFTQELCDAIITNKIKIKWSCVTRANISLETLKIMKKANGRTMHIGLESTNQEALDNINKGMNFLDEVEYLKNCKRVGILNHVCLIFGLPGDTVKTIKETIEVVKKLPSIDTIQIFPLIPTPFEDIFDKESKNTVWEYLTKNNYLITKDYSKWLKPNGLYNCVVSYPNLTNKQIESLIEIGYNKFYFRIPYILYKIRQSLLNWQDLKRNTKSFTIMMKRKMLKS